MYTYKDKVRVCGVWALGFGIGGSWASVLEGEAKWIAGP